MLSEPQTTASPGPELDNGAGLPPAKSVEGPSSPANGTGDASNDALAASPTSDAATGADLQQQPQTPGGSGGGAGLTAADIPTNLLVANANTIGSSLSLNPTAAVTADHDENDRKHLTAKEARRLEMHATLTDKSKLPKSYWNNSPKEDRTLKYVDNFELQYSTLYPHRTRLLLAPENEFGLRKFVCTTIRPTQLGYRELYDYRPCARFVADFISYQPLDPPYELARSLFPTYTLSMQSGNCFDMAVILVSLLRGAGYDAFVVSGYATRTLTLMDETHVDVDTNKLLQETGFVRTELGESERDAYSIDTGSQLLAKAETATTELAGKAVSTNGTGEDPKYKIKVKNALKSRYLATMEAKRHAEQERRQQLLKEKLAQQYTHHEEDDEIAGLRIHAWVLVLPGKREVAEAFFIEPSTGKVYDIEDPNYLGVESVFSSSNYWVNMQKCINGLKGITFDLSDTTKWEYIFVQNSQPTFAPSGGSGTNTRGGSAMTTATTGSDAPGSAAGGNVANADDDDDGDGKEGSGDTEVFDLPPSWVTKIELTKEQVASQCPAGTKVQMWRNAKMEVFAPYHRPDGMITRITLFTDPRRAERGSIHERFDNRADKLWKRVRVPARGLTHEFFERGRALALMEHVMEHGRTLRMRFFPGARSDGLYDRLEVGNKIIERFEGRGDRLVYRSVTHEAVNEGDEEFAPTADGTAAVAGADAGAARGTNAVGQQVTITKMTEKFSRRPGYTEEDDVALEPSSVANSTTGAAAAMHFGGRDVFKRVYHVREERIRIVYHTDVGALIPAWREFRKPSTEQKTTFMDLTTAFDTNPPLHALKRQHLYAKLCELLKAEQACLQAVKASDREIKEILTARQTEEKSIQLTVSLFDTIRNKTDIASELEKESQKQAEEASKEASVDYLSPFLVNVANPNSLTRDEALAVREACLRSFKERLIEKASIIQRRYEEETAAYQRRQQQYSKTAEGMTPAETDEYVAFCNEALFRIHVLEKRLSRHKDMAPEMYLQLDKKLRSDPRLRSAGQ
ncbi:hypothetical protein BCR44DRAFT_130074 [Catenaria anguillulae PL171]|uniref:Dynein regulatory complex subunit 7 n=1 Tax=Catenaria anguillulae PL171 TaxID=765915 RepID=A0A1Y2HKP2_9FUNG|nr:hypothetical protein BCR44DRAFT_130074 [Catenaria anguillulae PL171]